NPPPAPTISVQNNCGESVLTASNYSGTLLWSTGESTQSITVTAPGNYSLSQNVDGCTSNAATAAASPKKIPAITSIAENAPTFCTGQGSFDIVFTDVPDGIYTIEYDGGSFTGVIVANNMANVQASSGTYNNLIITVNECSSASGINATISAPIPPPAPTISVQDNCGESILTAANFTGILFWSTGETTESITVNTSGEYSLTQTVNGCTSDAATAIAAPKSIPVITSIAENNPLICQGQGTLDFTFTDVPNGTYSISYDGGSFTGVKVNGKKATVQANTGTYRNLTITVDGCSSPDGVNASLSDPNPPPAPTILVQDNCGESVLTAANYTGTLLWSTGESTQSITVTKAGDYFLTQTVGGCTSNAATATANPKTSSLKPEIDVADDCGESKITVTNLTQNAWLFWQFNNKTDSIQSESFTVTEKGEYTIYQKLGNCVSLDTTATVNPFDIPSPPTGSDKEICATDPIQTLTAEATASDNNTSVLWFDKATGGNEILLPVLDTIGTITYYAESKNNSTGCTSNSRTPVSLTIKPNAEATLIDTTIVGKPHDNVAVLIFPKNSMKYQWYLNNTEITNATNQFYYIGESDRQNGNIFTVEVEFQNGCKAKFNYKYSGNSVGKSVNAINSPELKNASKSFIIYPNPADNHLNIAVNTNQIDDKQKLNVKIYSVTGACIIEAPLDQNPKSIDTSHLQPGFYSVVIYNVNNRLVTKKLIVTKR
ncbi:MAG TPA: T9SS type A sorting domain-containing protein, partial [Draconibacterium sp.]|nr:T9SS type A sorting domain-containing protein [Draconibacterium sp.]